MTPNERLLGQLFRMSRVDIQNRLMSTTDREIAISMMYMTDIDRSRLFGFLSKVKSRRIQEELNLHARLSICYKDYLKAIDHVVAKLENTGARSRFQSYLRPRRGVPRSRK